MNDDKKQTTNDRVGGDKRDDKLTELEQKCAEYLDGWKRARADYQNLIKDTTKEKVELIKFANQNLLLELLPILDNFKLAFIKIPDAEKNSAWVIGFSHIKKQLEDFLKENGVEEIKTVGEKFDPMLHEAVGNVESENGDSGVIVEEKRAGYKLHGKVAQAAKVIVKN